VASVSLADRDATDNTWIRNCTEETGLLPDEALVVRGGRNRPEDIARAFGVHPSGTTGVSVESAAGLTLTELAAGIPHGQVGVATVGRVRAAGGDVIRTSGRSPNHATLVGLTPGTTSALLTPTVPNPARDQE
jgi:hypothetical protein